MGYIHAHTTTLNHKIKKYNKSQGQVLGCQKVHLGFSLHIMEDPKRTFWGT